MSFDQWLGFIACILGLTILWQIRQLLLLLFAAIVVANALNHLAIRLQKKGLNRGSAIAISVSCLLGGLSLFLGLIIPPFLGQLRHLSDLVPEGINRVMIHVKQIAAHLDPDLINALPNWQQFSQQLQPVTNQIAGQGLSLFYSTLGLPLSLLLLLALSLMLLADPIAYRQGLLRLVPAFYRQRGDQILRQCENVLEDWFVAILAKMAIIAILTFLGLGLLQVPLPLALGLLAGLFAFIPHLGPLLSLIPAIAIAFLGSYWNAMLVLILYIIIYQLENNIITPKIISKQVQILPGMLLLGQVIFASLFGFLGLFLAYPLSLITQVFVKEILVKDILNPWGDLES
ncbi:MAG: AI-2E family transporter [Microcystaceae cyanobacterium]